MIHWCCTSIQHKQSTNIILCFHLGMLHLFCCSGWFIYCSSWVKWCQQTPFWVENSCCLVTCPRHLYWLGFVSAVPSDTDAVLLHGSERLRSWASVNLSSLTTRKQSVHSFCKEPTTPRVTVPKSVHQQSRYITTTTDFSEQVCSSSSYDII